MAIVFSCPRCDQRYSVPESMAGRRVSCKKCGQERTVPAEAPASAPAAPPAPRPATRPPARPVAAVREEPPVFDEDDDLDKPLDDFDELPASEALMPRPKRPAFAAPSAPKKAKKKAVRRETDDLPFPPLVTFGLGLFGLILLLSGLSMVAGESQKGNPNAGSLGVVTVLFVASFGLMIVAVFKVLLHANKYSGFLAALGCLFIPFFILGYVALNFHGTKRYLLWYAGGVAGIIVTILILPAIMPVGRANARGARAGALPPGFVIPGGHAQDYALEIIATGLPDELAADLFQKKIDDIRESNPSGGGMFGSGWANGKIAFSIYPVRDPEAFVERISFAKKMKLSGRTLTLTADLSEADLADARQAKAEETAREAQLKVEALARDADIKAADAARALAAKEKAENPFQEKTAAAPAEMKFNPNAGPIDKLLYETRNSNGFKAREAIQALASGVPEERRAEVVAALAPMLESRDVFTASATLKTLSALKGPEAVAAILSKLDVESMRREAIQALGQMGDPSAAEGIAEHLNDGWPHATRALQALGPEAEPAVIAKLRDPDSQVRSQALEVLAEIGGADTIRAMRSLPADEDGGIRMSANRTMEKILKRTGPVSKAKPAAGTKAK